MTPLDITLLAFGGMLAGVVGGLVGVGGSIVLIPLLTIGLGKDQQLAQATAMIINVFVATPSLYQHHRAGAVNWGVVWKMLPIAVVAIILGVEASNRVDGLLLQRIFGGFLLYVIAFNIAKLLQERRDNGVARPRLTLVRVGVTGGSMGLLAGLLGIGGGPIAIPLLQRLCRLPLRHAIGSTTAVMCLTSLFGAVRKNATLNTLAASREADYSLHASLELAIYLAPAAVAGAFLGAWLTHKLPIRLVRIAFILLISWASVEMLGIV